MIGSCGMGEFINSRNFLSPNCTLLNLAYNNMIKTRRYIGMAYYNMYCNPSLDVVADIV